jgi:hypothetical protein
LRDAHDLKRQFNTNKNLCDNEKKVTGSAAPKPMTARCQAIWLRILAKSSAKNCGGSNSDDETSESEEESEVNEQHDENAGNEELFDDPPYGSQYNSQQYDETHFEEDNIDDNEVYENVDRPSVNESPCRFINISFLSNAAQSRSLPAAAVPVRAATPLPTTANVISQSSRLTLRDPFTSSAQRHDGHRSPIPPVPSNRGSREPSPVPAPVPTRSQKKRPRSESEEMESGKECTLQSSEECRGSCRHLS